MMNPSPHLEGSVTSAPLWANEVNITEKFAWSAALAHPPRPPADGLFAHSETFTTRCVQPNILISQQLVGDRAKEKSLDSALNGYGKASFLPGNWEKQDACFKESVPESTWKKDRQSLKRSSSGRKQIKSKKIAFEDLTKRAKLISKRKSLDEFPCQNLSPWIDRGDPPEDRKGLADAITDTMDVNSKKVDGKYVCDRIYKETGTICGKKIPAI